MYAPANLLKVLVKDPETQKLRGFQKYVHFPLSDGLLLAGGKGLPVGKLAMVSYDGENNLMTAYVEEVLEPTDNGTIQYFLQHSWEEFNP